MKTIRRINKALALLLVLVMALTVIPMSAMADEPSGSIATVQYSVNGENKTAELQEIGDAEFAAVSLTGKVYLASLPNGATVDSFTWATTPTLDTRINKNGLNADVQDAENYLVDGDFLDENAGGGMYGSQILARISEEAKANIPTENVKGFATMSLRMNSDANDGIDMVIVQINSSGGTPQPPAPTNFATVTYATGDSASATGEKELIYHTTAGTLERYFYTMSLPYGAEIESIVWDATNTYASRMFAGLTQALNPEAGALPAAELYLTDGEFTDGTSGHAAYKAQYNTLSNEAKAMILDHNVKGFIVAATIVGVAQEVIFVQISTSENGSQPTTYNVTVTGNVAADITAAATATEFEPYSFTLTKPWAYRIYDYDIAVTVDGEALPAAGLLVDDSSYSSVNTAITYTIIGDYVDGDIAITANRTAPYSFALTDGTACETLEGLDGGQLWSSVATIVRVPVDTESIVISRDAASFVGLHAATKGEPYIAVPDSGYTMGTLWTEATYDADTDCFTLPLRLLPIGEAEAANISFYSHNGYSFDDNRYFVVKPVSADGSGGYIEDNQIVIEKPRATFDVTVTGSGAADVTSAPETVKEFWNYSFTISKQEGCEYTVTAVMGKSATPIDVTEDEQNPGTYTIGWDVITGDVTITVEKTDPSAPAVQVVSASLTLKGDIGVNYYVIPNAALMADQNAYAQFTYKGDTGKPILLSTVEPNKEGEYCFTQYVAAKEMTEQIALRFYTGDGEPVALTNARNLSIEDNAALYSVARYIANAPQDAQALAGKLASYGAYAKAYFKNQIVTEDTDFASNVTTQTVNETADALINFKPSKDGSAEGVKNLYVSLTLKSMTTLNIIFELEEGQQMPAVTVKGESYTPEPVGSRYYIRIANIPAKDLDTPYTIKIGGLTLNCSALSYAYNVLNAYTNTDGKEGICNLVRALYEYNVSANEYFSNQNGE